MIDFTLLDLIFVASIFWGWSYFYFFIIFFRAEHKVRILTCTYACIIVEMKYYNKTK